MRVFKFGGASVKDAEAVRNMATIVRELGGKNKLLVVVSAMGKTTNKLEESYNAYLEGREYKSLLEELKNFHLDIAKDLFSNAEDEAIFDLIDRIFGRLAATLERQALHENYDEGYDQIVSYGEVISTQIIAHYLRKISVNAVWTDARQFIQTDSTWREAKVDWVWTEKIIWSELGKLLENNIIVTQGFIGGTVENKTTTLGREGSDFSAAVFAHCLKAESLTIWKDVPGVLNADPKKGGEVTLLKNLSYADAAEMTYYGATVIHPKTIWPLAQRNIPLKVRSFVKPSEEGTTISYVGGKIEKAIRIVKPNQILLKLSTADFGFIGEKHLYHIIEVANRNNLKINLLQVSATSLRIVSDQNERKVERFKQALRDSFVWETVDNCQLLTLRGDKVNEKDIPSELRGYKVLLQELSANEAKFLFAINV